MVAREIDEDQGVVQHVHGLPVTSLRQQGHAPIAHGQGSQVFSVSIGAACAGGGRGRPGRS